MGYKKAWNEYSKNYNVLANRMQEQKIDVGLLAKVLQSHAEMLKPYQSMYQSQRSNTRKDFKHPFNSYQK